MKKVAVITGASKGIGKETALALSEKQFIVCLLARQSNELTELEQQINQSGGTAFAQATDVSNGANVEASIQACIQKFGRIDLLVNNAGIGVFKEVSELTEEEWDRVMDVNVKGTFLPTKAVLPIMRKQKSGLIIGVASDVSKRTFAVGSLYCASKYAQDAFLSALRKEVRKDGIRVSVVYPGMTATIFHRDPDYSSHLGEWLDPVHLANGIAYIATLPDNVVLDEMTMHPLAQEY